MKKLDNFSVCFKRNHKTFYINYHIISENLNDDISVNDQYVAYNCSSWIDAINQLNDNMFKLGKFYLIESFWETED